MEIDINILALKRPELADDLKRLAEWGQPEIRLWRKPFEEVRRIAKAKVGETLTYKGMVLICGPGQRSSRKKAPKEIPLF